MALVSKTCAPALPSSILDKTGWVAGWALAKPQPPTFCVKSVGDARSRGGGVEACNTGIIQISSFANPSHNTEENFTICRMPQNLHSSKNYKEISWKKKFEFSREPLHTVLRIRACSAGQDGGWTMLRDYLLWRKNL